MLCCFLPKMDKKGQALILSYMIIAVFIIFSAALFSIAFTERNISLRDRLNTEAFYLAEGGTENAITVFTSSIANYQIQPDVVTLNVNTAYTTFGGATVNSVINRLEDTDRLILENQTNILVRNYEVVSTVVHPANNGITKTIHQIIARRLIPTFQHVVFYDGDLEILPGANMTVTGRIHCNHDIYADSDGATLTIDSFYMHSAGDIFNQRKDSGTLPPGDAKIRKDKPGAPQYEYMNNFDSESPDWTSGAIDRWNGTVQSAVHGVTKLTAPSVASIQPDGYYEDNADVVIENNTITRNGHTLTQGVDCPAGTVTSTTDFYNNREGKTVKMTNIDLKKLAGYAPGNTAGSPSFPNNLPSNGLMYANRNDVGGTYEPGTRLINGQEIYNNSGLTMVSTCPAYIQGDYNTINKKPASVIADSLNLLSNNWNDSNSTKGLSSRAASNTTFDSAFIAGTDQTTSGHYNGGLENYPRLHEDWSNKQLNITGSFVSLWNSSVATGAWQYGSPQYTAPLRSWNYDTDFNNTNKLPPFTPWAVEAQRIAWWED